MSEQLAVDPARVRRQLASYDTAMERIDAQLEPLQEMVDRLERERVGVERARQGLLDHPAVKEALETEERMDTKAIIERIREASFEAPRPGSHTEWARRIESILDEAFPPR